MKILLFAAAAVVVAVVALALRRDESVPDGQAPPAPSTPPADRQDSRWLAGYRLEERETEFLGAWRETRIGGTRVAFQTAPGFLSAYVGEFDPDVEQLTELYLGVAGPENPLPSDRSEQRIDRFLDERGKALASRYFLYATGPSDFPQLRVPGVRDALAALSDSILELGFYEDGGMHLEFDVAKVSAASVEGDVRYAVAAVKALDEAPVAN